MTVDRKGKKRAASPDAEDAIATMKKIKKECITFHPEEVTLSELLGDDDLTATELRALAAYWGVKTKGYTRSKTRQLKESIANAMIRSMKCPKAGSSASVSEDEEDDDDTEDDAAPAPRDVVAILFDVTTHIKTLSKLSAENFTRHEDSIVDLAARVEHLEAQVVANTESLTDQSRQVTALNAQNEQINERLNNAERQWVRTHERLNETVDQMSASMGEIRNQIGWMQHTTQNQLTTIQEIAQREHQNFGNVLMTLNTNLADVQARVTTMSNETTGHLFAINHHGCGLLIASILPNVMASTSTNVIFSAEPEEYFFFINHKCTEEQRNRILHMMPRDEQSTHIRFMAVYGTLNNVHWAVNQMRNWLSKPSRGKEWIVPL
ncbi:uncharacterized protein SPPG_04855 [Spizellomyces punctatus DAOM BR117]|uniref:Uncharacterized protein n=1 Tax=Spizellomyces punctatus (strain DAOM BR117) TaxID=645134 RepID=A0A0L0HHI4_SPIPD|nr:uncharacterized protein SPPG_04855 [Spizellomyces punctatus DAOM BR117]KND00547.1 hypothetical protein SPPG_04855 [Spizellomyces punctatus DAOM BR117]|eukprot:XP_016608586.1 hypothetical protein SPPG_04855 [Spizellomyces punctatus DAOM BR117]